MQIFPLLMLFFFMVVLPYAIICVPFTFFFRLACRVLTRSRFDFSMKTGMAFFVVALFVVSIVTNAFVLILHKVGLPPPVYAVLSGVLATALLAHVARTSLLKAKPGEISYIRMFAITAFPACLVVLTLLACMAFKLVVGKG